MAKSRQLHVAVTGAAGFIGSHLVDRLVADGHRVTAVDNLVTGRMSNLSDALATGKVEFIEADVTDVDSLLGPFSDVDRLFHLAALADIVPSIERPLDYVKANVDGTTAVMEAARESHIGRVVYAASASCYGFPEDIPTPETSPMDPRYPYALTKYLGEQICFHWGQVYDIDVMALRLFNVYGPRSRTTGAYGAVMGVFIAQSLAGQPMTIVGSGEQTRDFTYVTDVADAFATAGDSNISGEVFNVGSGGTYSINRLTELIGGSTLNIPKRPGEPDSTYADISRIREHLGWAPITSFEEGVRKIMENADDWREAPVWTPETIEDATRSWFGHLGATDPK